MAFEVAGEECLRWQEACLPDWPIDLMLVHLRVSLFGGASWRQLATMRAFLRAWWPRNRPLPVWICRTLDLIFPSFAHVQEGKQGATFCNLNRQAWEQRANRA